MVSSRLKTFVSLFWVHPPQSDWTQLSSFSLKPSISSLYLSILFYTHTPSYTHTHKYSSEMGIGRQVTTSLDGVRDKNIMQLKKLNSVLFPVRYNDKYYADALASGEFTKLAYYSDICVGSIACRLEKKEGGAVRVYIMTLGVLAPYRGLGIGTKLLNHVIDLCTKQNISEIYLHVQTNNDDAIQFYKKFGFEITDTIQNYYTNITPPDCYVVTRFINQETKK